MGYKDKQKQNSYQLGWYKKRRLEWFKTHGPCQDCANPKSLKLHRIDDSTFSHSIWSWKKERFDEAIKSFTVLCRKCSDKRTLQKKYGVNYPHGTEEEWLRGCRCPFCRVARVDMLMKKRRASANVREFRKRFEQRVQAKLQQSHLVLEIPYNGNYNGVRHEEEAREAQIEASQEHHQVLSVNEGRGAGG